MAKKGVGKVTDVCRISDRMIFIIKVLVQRMIISVISVYALQCGVDDNLKDGLCLRWSYIFRWCCCRLVTIVLVIYDLEPYQCSKKIFKKTANYFVTYESGPSKAQVHYCLIRGNQRKFLKGIKVLPS